MDKFQQKKLPATRQPNQLLAMSLAAADLSEYQRAARKTEFNSQPGR
jgi:hypothetical protein